MKLNMVDYMDYRLTVSIDVIYLMGIIVALDINIRCCGKVFIIDKLKNRFINIKSFLLKY